MRFHVAALLLPAALLAVACDENAPPPDRPSQGATLQQSAGPRGSSAVVEDPITIPQGAMYTILCETYTGPDHVEHAADLKSLLIHLTGKKEFYVIHKENQSLLYYGFYKAVEAADDQAEHNRIEADLHWVKTLTDSRTGDLIFRVPYVTLLDAPDPVAPPEWNLANAPAEMFWSLQIAAYKSIPDRKEAAVARVRELRKNGVPAYYYQGDTVSSVCVGLWPVTAVKNQAEGDPHGNAAHTDDPAQDLMVFGNSSAPPGVNSEEVDPSGRMAKVEGIKLEIMDPTLKDMIAKYPNEDVDGQYHYKQLPNGGKFFDQTFLVQVPHNGPGGQAAPTAPPDQPPASAGNNLPPDPTEGALHSGNVGLRSLDGN